MNLMRKILRLPHLPVVTREPRVSVVTQRPLLWSETREALLRHAGYYQRMADYAAGCTEVPGLPSMAPECELMAARCRAAAVQAKG